MTYPVKNYSKANMQALGRMKGGEMNKTEAAYAEHLKLLEKLGEISFWRFEPMNLKIGAKCHYRPDFLVINKEGEVEIHEVKGFWTDDARVKIKVAAAIFPFKFIAIKKKTKKEGGGWQYEEF